MNKKFVLMVFTSVFLLLAMVGAQFLSPSFADPAIIRVPANYPTIQEAINTANPGDIVQVAPGTYYEHVIVNKSLSLIGENGSTTVIDGNGTGSVVHTMADNAYISGFTIRNGWYGIRLMSSNNTVSGNNIGPDNGDGIRMDNCSGNTISDNIITSNVYGIHLRNATNNAISNNQISNNGIGPYLAMGGGIDLFYSNNNLISNNAIANNIAFGGVQLDNANNNTIIGNTLLNNSGDITLFGLL